MSPFPHRVTAGVVLWPLRPDDDVCYRGIVFAFPFEPNPAGFTLPIAVGLGYVVLLTYRPRALVALSDYFVHSMDKLLFLKNQLKSAFPPNQDNKGSHIRLQSLQDNI